MTDENGNPLFTAAQVAATLGKAPSTVRANAVRFGIGRKLGRDWVFSEKDIERLATLPLKRGRPPKKR